MFKNLKKLIRSGSISYTINSIIGRNTGKLKTYNWKGHTLYYRAGMADAGALYEILIRPKRPMRRSGMGALIGKKLEYWIPPEVEPKVILDIGGNIGTTSVYYAHMFPEAKIYTFEPVKDNFEILQKNVEDFPNISAFNVALGKENTTAKIYICSDNYNTGGFSMYDLEVDKNKYEEITVKKTDEFLKELGVGEVDLIKIDTEGAEYDILTSMDTNMLSKVRWMLGELHGERDFELLAYLSQWFEVDMDKSLRSRLFDFNACNREYTAQIPWKR